MLRYTVEQQKSNVEYSAAKFLVKIPMLNRLEKDFVQKSSCVRCRNFRGGIFWPHPVCVCDLLLSPIILNRSVFTFILSSLCVCDSGEIFTYSLKCYL